MAVVAAVLLEVSEVGLLHLSDAEVYEVLLAAEGIACFAAWLELTEVLTGVMVVFLLVLVAG